MRVKAPPLAKGAVKRGKTKFTKNSTHTVDSSYSLSLSDNVRSMTSAPPPLGVLSIMKKFVSKMVVLNSDHLI